MKLIDFRVKNFRSIELEQHFNIPGRLTFVGPNNTGKTNLLRAIELFFKAHINDHVYDCASDLPFGARRMRTSITATFEGDPSVELSIFEKLDELHELQGTQRSENRISLNLYFTEKNNAVYRVFPNVKRPKDRTKAAHYSRTHKNLYKQILDKFSTHYVPSAKSVREINSGLIEPFLRRKVAEALKPYEAELIAPLESAAQALNKELEESGLDMYKTRFSLPSSRMEEFFSGFDFLISDPTETTVDKKGMGVQTTAILAAFKWITQQEINDGYHVVWLLEEPESYLHPNLAWNCNRILDSLSVESTVIVTTHSLAFVPQDPGLLRGTSVENKRTEVKLFKSFFDATSAIRNSLGVKFGDYFNLSKLNIFVEGDSDKEIFQWVLDRLPENKYPLARVRAAMFESFGGVSLLADFLRFTYSPIREDCCIFAIFDGDEAGKKAIRELQSYFGNKNISFQSNQDYALTRNGFPVEGMFPDGWIKLISEEHSSWFEAILFDSSNELCEFKLKNSRKKSFRENLMMKAEKEDNVEWAKKFVELLEIADAALEEQFSRNN